MGQTMSLQELQCKPFPVFCRLTLTIGKINLLVLTWLKAGNEVRLSSEKLQRGSEQS